MHLLNQGNSNICIICGEYTPPFRAKSITLVICSQSVLQYREIGTVLFYSLQNMSHTI